MTPAQQARQDLRTRLRDLLRKAISYGPGYDMKLTDAYAIIGHRNISSLTLDEIRRCIFILEQHSAMNAPAATPTVTPAAQDDGVTYPPEDGEDDAGEDNAGEDDAAVERELSEIRSNIASGGFIALDEKLRSLVIAARKPPVTIIKEVQVQVALDPSAPVVQAKLTGKTVTWRAAFGVKGALGSRTCQVWDGAHPDTPSVNHDYVWPERTAVALTQIARGRNPYLWGPAGIGKTEFAQQIAARLGRPFMLISCDASTDAATLVGMTVPCKSGGVTFQPGQLVRAIQTAGAVICIDEPTMARPGALFVFQNVLTPNRALYVQETGARIRTAPGVIFVATDNTNGTGGGSRRGFHGTQALNAATLDRFGVRIKLDWHDPSTEARIITRAVPGCTQALADLLVQAATTTRAAADSQVLTQGLGLRRLFSWAECLTDGLDVETAFCCAIQDCVPEAERETLRQQCMLAVDKFTVARALSGTGPDTDMPPDATGAAADFDVVTN